MYLMLEKVYIPKLWNGKQMKKIFTIVFALLLLILSLLPCYAMNSWLETEPIDETEAKEIFSRMNIKIITEPDSVKGFTCFDVNENGDFILGYDDSTNNVLIFNQNSNFLCGFSFEQSASVGVQLDNDKIIVYRTLGELAVLIDRDGNLLEMDSISDTIENNTAINCTLYSNERQVGDITYKAEKSVFFSSMYSKLIKIEKDGTETVLFDVSKQNLIGTIIVAVLIVSAFASIITYFVITIKKLRQSGHNRGKSKQSGKQSGDGSLS